MILVASSSYYILWIYILPFVLLLLDNESRVEHEHSFCFLASTKVSRITLARYSAFNFRHPVPRSDTISICTCITIMKAIISKIPTHVSAFFEYHCIINNAAASNVSTRNLVPAARVFESSEAGGFRQFGLELALANSIRLIYRLKFSRLTFLAADVGKLCLMKFSYRLSLALHILILFRLAYVK